jgi:hypothetical protein
VRSTERHEAPFFYRLRKPSVHAAWDREHTLRWRARRLTDRDSRGLTLPELRGRFRLDVEDEEFELCFRHLVCWIPDGRGSRVPVTRQTRRRHAMTSAMRVDVEPGAQGDRR